MNTYISVLKKYAVFSGRAARHEYWMFILFHVLISMALAWLAMYEVMLEPLVPVYALAVFLPGLGVAIRRLHDTGRSGWWLLIGLLPVVGSIVLLVFMVLDSQPGTNAYGPNPKGVAAPTAA